jgi:hypothetical protein
MICRTTSVPEGVGILCGPRPRRARCTVCHCLGAELLCDGPGRAPGGTCDAKLCRGCARSIGADVDYCPTCFDVAARTAADVLNDWKGAP